jgi:hypothetical protein
MTRLRLLLPLCVALVACQPATQAEPQRKVRTPPLAQPQPSVPAPAERVDRREACRVDADCQDAPQCIDADACKCVDDRCLAAKQEIEPIVDPAPNVSVQ